MLIISIIMRYRILAWLACVLLAVASLLTQCMASPWILVPCATLPALGTAALLYGCLCNMDA